jgi:hypothetical protein
VNGGTLRTSADFDSARAVSLGPNGGTFQTDANLALSSGITGTGGLNVDKRRIPVKLACSPRP